MESTSCPNNKTIEVESAIIRFAGDSGDGMQITGSRFTAQTAIQGNDLATLPDFPAEIRAPAGTIAGVSSFQIHFGKTEIYTAGDDLDVLIAMNPAALKANLKDLKANGILICNQDAFTKKNLEKVGYESDPSESEELHSKYNFILAPISNLTAEALKECDLPNSSVEKCKNFFALGIVSWIYGRKVDDTLNWLESKFKNKPEVAKANKLALQAGMAFAQASEIVTSSYIVKEAELPEGKYRTITGNLGIAYGLVAAGTLMEESVMFAGYPITPASDILHELSRHKSFGVITFQAEDEIAACCAAVGSSFSGRLGVTASSGPGIALKQEAIGLAICTELPLVIVNVQRAGPSTGMPTKTEQADLLEVLYGRNGESPCAVLAISSPGDAFETTIEACRIAVEHMLPVFLLSDGYVGNGSEPWMIPDVSKLENFKVTQAKLDGDKFYPYARDTETLARPWAKPGTPGLEHRIGGLEKEDHTGNVCYVPENHELMTKLRAEKVERIANNLPATEVFGENSGDTLVISWGGTFAAVRGAVMEAQKEGLKTSHIHLRYLNPFPKDLEEISKNFKNILVPELNTGQLKLILQAKFIREIKALNKVQGQPFKIAEVLEAIKNV